MTNAIKIDIKKSGFPVKIGKVELWFDDSIENLTRFLSIDKIVNEKLKKVHEKAAEFPDDIPDDIEEIKKLMKNFSTEKVNAALEVNKEYISAQYDVIFGDGSFEKVYKEYPDLRALEDALEPISQSIAERIEQQEGVRRGVVDKEIKEALKKK